MYLIGAVLALGAGGYYYYSQNPERVDALAHKAKAEEELAVKNAKELKNNAMVRLHFLSISKTTVPPQVGTVSRYHWLID